MGDVFKCAGGTLKVGEGAAYGAALQGALVLAPRRKARQLGIHEITDQFSPTEPDGDGRAGGENVAVYRETAGPARRHVARAARRFTQHRRFVLA